MPALKGTGLLKGMGVTLRTMSRRAATRQYPHVRPDLPPRTRGVIALIEENCTVCMLCSRECPDWCIYIDSHKEQVAPKEGGRARTRNMLDRFAIDFALCMYCGICVEVCPFDALHWSPEFEYAEYDRDLLTHEMPRLREWAYTVLPPDQLEVGAQEPKEIAAARKAEDAQRAKAEAAVQAAAEAAAAAPAPPPAATNGAPAAAPVAAANGAPAATPATAAEAAGGGVAAPPRPPDVHVEPGIDQETFDRLVAAGESERTARAKAKASYMRKAKAAARAEAAAVPAAPAPTDAGGVEVPASALSAPETAPEASAAAGASEAAEPAADARAPDLRSPDGDPTASATEAQPAADVQVEPGIDQETYDRLLAEGESDRTARAKAKAVYMRRAKRAARGETE